MASLSAMRRMEYAHANALPRGEACPVNTIVPMLLRLRFVQACKVPALCQRSGRCHVTNQRPRLCPSSRLRDGRSFQAVGLRSKLKFCSYTQ